MNTSYSHARLRDARDVVTFPGLPAPLTSQRTPHTCVPQRIIHPPHCCTTFRRTIDTGITPSSLLGEDAKMRE